jgi:hypothetical protein
MREREPSAGLGTQQRRKASEGRGERDLARQARRCRLNALPLHPSGREHRVEGRLVAPEVRMGSAGLPGRKSFVENPP